MSSSEDEFLDDLEELKSQFDSYFDDGPPTPFLIVSKMNGKVLDIKNCKKAQGTKVIMYDRKAGNNANQLWYFDSDGYIKSFLNRMTMFAEDAGDPLTTSTTNDPRGKWRIDGERIVNGIGQCLDIRGASNSNKAELCAYKWNGDSNQKWSIEFV